MTKAKQSTPATKADLDALRKDLISFKEEMKSFFKVVVENLKKDFRDIFNDRSVDLTTAQLDHERRIKDLENRVGVLS